MSGTTLLVLVLTGLPAIALAQADTTRRRDTTRTPVAADSARRVSAESRGEVDVSRSGVRFSADLPNYGLSADQAVEVQQALTRAGCDVGAADGIVGERTLRGVECFRGLRQLATTDLEPVLTALNVSFARPAPPPEPPPAPPRKEPTLPPVIRPDTTYRADVRARRDSALRRDSTLRRDSLGRDSTARRDSTAPKDTTRRPMMR
jgi:peptidoglycan hydrolase-like protein with peptidoglycan-binding domain